MEDLLALRDILAHPRFTSGKSVVAQQFINPMRGQALFGWQAAILLQQVIDASLIGTKDWPRPCSSAPGTDKRGRDDSFGDRITANAQIAGNLA